MTDHDFKGGIHAAAASLFAVMAAYNLMCLLTTRAPRHAVNVSLYAPLWGFELYQTWYHWKGSQP